MKQLKKILNRSDVCSLLQELILHDRFKNIELPTHLSKNSFITNNFAFLIVTDALIKYSIIIEDETYLTDYLEQLRRVLKKFKTYQDIETAINTIIGKVCALKLELPNTHHKENKDKILRYIYNKYIVNGYFYYGFSSSYKNEIDFIGIRKEGLIVDNKLEKLNTLLNQYNLDYLYKEKTTNITDSFPIALYHAFMSPIYLEAFAKSKAFNQKKYDTKCIYTKNIKELKEILDKLTADNKFTKEDKTIFINTFLDILEEDKIATSTPMLAFIKRQALNKNYLKDFELIMDGKEDNDLTTSISLIIESRYESYELEEDIPNIAINTVRFPTYEDITKGNERYIELEEDKDDLDIADLKEEELEINDLEKPTSYLAANSYGITTIAILGFSLIVVGYILSIILKIYT